MHQSGKQGFTLIEVVLAIAVGLIIIAGVSVGYTYAKRAAIIDNQRKNIGAIKTFVEQAITSLQAAAASGQGSLVPPPITNSQLTALADRLTSLKFDPYTGAQRLEGCTAASSCYTVITAQPNGSYGPSLSASGLVSGNGIGDVLTNLAGGMAYAFLARTIGVPDLPIWSGGAGSAVVYVPGTSFQATFQVTMADGSTRTLYGYVVFETDENGNFVAAEGGDTTIRQIGGQVQQQVLN